MNQEKREQMLREGKPLLQKLEECIEQFGDEFQKWADDYFWLESDIVPILMGRLWEQEILMHNFKNPLGDGKVPLVHAEKKLAKGGRIDLYLLDADTAVESIREYAYDDEIYRSMEILAGVQVEGPELGGKLRGYCTKAVETLSNSREQIAQPYLVVFAMIQLLEQKHSVDYTARYQRLLEFLRKKHKGDWSSLGLNIYCVPAYSVPFRPPPSERIKPEWIR